MRVLARVGAAVVFLGVALLTGCGGSVADADTNSAGSGSVRTSTPTPSPFCTAAKANSDALRPLNGMASGGTRPESLSGAVEQVRRTGSELVRVAPDEIRSDVERTVQAVNLQLDALVANGGDTAALARDPELVARLNSPELAGAGDRYRSYVNRTCIVTGATRGSG